MDFGERLINLRKERGFKTRREFAAALDLPETTVRNYERNEREPGHVFLKAASRVLNTSVDYLLGITDDPERTSSYQLRSSERALVDQYRSLDDVGKDHVATVLGWESDRVNLAENATAQMPVRIIQYFQKVSAGSGQIIEDDLPPESISIPDIPKFRRAAYALMVSGRSMEPMFYDGELLLIEPTCIVDIGEIGIFSVDGMCYVKKRGERELISLNSEYRNIPLNSEARCMGRVIGKISKRN